MIRYLFLELERLLSSPRNVFIPLMEDYHSIRGANANDVCSP